MSSGISSSSSSSSSSSFKGTASIVSLKETQPSLNFSLYDFELRSAGESDLVQIHGAAGAKVSPPILSALRRRSSFFRLRNPEIDLRALELVKEIIYSHKASFRSRVEMIRTITALGELQMYTELVRVFGTFRLRIDPGNALSTYKIALKYEKHLGSSVKEIERYICTHFAFIASTSEWIGQDFDMVCDLLMMRRMQHLSPSALLSGLLLWILRTEQIVDSAVLNAFLIELMQQVVLPRKTLEQGISLINSSETRSCGAPWKGTAFSQLSGILLEKINRLSSTPKRDQVPLTNGKWEIIANLPVARAGLSLVAQGPTLFAFGGKEAQKPEIPIVEHFEIIETIPSKEIYEAAIENHLSVHVDVAATKTSSTTSIVLGGCSLLDGKVTNRAALYNRNTRGWAKLPDLPEARAGMNVGLLMLKHNEVYALVVAGGGDAMHCDSSKVWALELRFTQSTWEWSKRWVQCQPLQHSRWSSASTVINLRELVILGGISNDGDTALSSCEVLRLPDALESIEALQQLQWREFPAMPFPRHSFGAFTFSTPEEEDVVVVTGGRDNGGKDLRDGLSLRLESKSHPAWKPIHASLCHARSSFGYATFDSGAKLLLAVVGGVSGKTVLSSVETLEINFQDLN